jgi:hypothetical protein
VLPSTRSCRPRSDRCRGRAQPLTASSTSGSVPGSLPGALVPRPAATIRGVDPSSFVRRGFAPSRHLSVRPGFECKAAAEPASHAVQRWSMTAPNGDTLGAADGAAQAVLFERLFVSHPAKPSEATYLGYVESRPRDRVVCRISRLPRPAHTCCPRPALPGWCHRSAAPSTGATPRCGGHHHRSRSPCLIW